MLIAGTPGPRGPRRRLAVAASSTLAAVISVVLVLAGGAITPVEAVAACPDSGAQARSADGYTIRIHPERNPSGHLLLHLCTDPAAEAIRRWRLTAPVAGNPSRELPVIATGSRAALSAETNGTPLNLSITVVTESGRERHLTTVGALG